MALIFSPLTEDILEGPYQPIPKGVFLMLQLGEGTAQLELEMGRAVSDVVEQRKFIAIRADAQRSQKDFLDKIIQLIRGCGFGAAIFSEYTPPSTLANIFFEVALCNLLGKPVIIVKSEEAKAPSDFVRTEWVTYSDKKKQRFKRDFSEAVSSVMKLADYYDKLGDIAMEAEETDLELAFERYKQAFLIAGYKKVSKKIGKINVRARSEEDFAAVLKPARSRFRSSISEFTKFLDSR